MSDLRSATSRSTLLDNLYAAAETLLQAVADPIIIDEAPLNHRAQALDAIGRFIDRIEKREAAREAQQPRPEEKVWDPNEPIYELVFPERTQEDVDSYVALELEHPGRFPDMEDVAERIAYLEQNDPEALERFDPHLARQWRRHRNPGGFTNHIWPDGDPHPSTVHKQDVTQRGRTPTPRVDPDRIRSQIAPLSPHSGHGASL
jgi:hypothetical protein